MGGERETMTRKSLLVKWKRRRERYDHQRRQVNDAKLRRRSNCLRRGRRAQRPGKGELHCIARTWNSMRSASSGARSSSSIS